MGRLLPLALAALTLSLALVFQAKAGSVEGSVRRLPSSSNEGVLRDHYWKVWNGVLPLRTTKEPLHNVTIAITGTGTGTPSGCDVTLSSGRMSPQTIAAREGTSLRFKNRDPFSHVLHARGLASVAGLELAPGKTQTVDVPAGGPWPIVDRNYAHVHGTVHSIPNLVACATIRSDDKFRIPNLPAGTYQLLVLQGPNQVASRSVTVRQGRPARVEALPVPTKKAD